MGISGGELVVLLILVFLLVGPEKLPELAQQLGRLVRELKKLATGAKEKVQEELGPEFQDLSAFDPRQYDPRRIVREALMDEPAPAAAARPPAARRPPARPAARAPGPATAAAMAGAVAGAAVVPPSGQAATTDAADQETGTAGSVPNGDLLVAGAALPRDEDAAVATSAGQTAPDASATPAGQTAPVEEYVVPFDDEAT